jgi:long-chain acyl-CoA synthetase
MLTGQKTLGRLLKQRVSKSPEKYALGWIENNEVKNMTFLDYERQIAILVNAFHKLNLHSGDKVAILGATSKEWHCLDLAVLCSRAVVIPVYPSYLAHEVDHIFKHSDSSIIVVENDKQMEKIIPLLSKWENLKTIISITDLSEEVLKKFRNLYPYYSFKDLLKIGTEEMKAQPDYFETIINSTLPEDMASIIYTSGTTGEPKGAVITQNAFVTMLNNVDATIHGAINTQDKTLIFLPLSHVFGRCDSYLPLTFGSQGVYAESIDKILDNIQVVQPTIMMAVPRIFEKIYSKIMAQIEHGNVVEKQAFKWAVKVSTDYYAKIDRDLSPTTKELIEHKLAYKIVFSKIYQKFGGKIRYFVSGGAPLSADIIRFLRFANLTILEGYGLTETVAPCCLNPLSKQIPGTVGRPMGDVQISFEEDGEILIRSEALMREYYKNPKATEEAIVNGWFHSGDIGEFTPEGFLKITDRKKDLIVTSGGKKVAPQMIENMAKTKAHISQFVVIGEKKNYLTALVGIEKEAFLNQLEELGLPSNCSVEDLAKHPKVHEIIQVEINQMNEQLAQFETIKKFAIVTEEFTTDNFLTPSLKIKRKVVSEKYKTEIEALYQ